MGFMRNALVVAVTAAAVQLWPVFFTPRLVYQFNGHVEPGFEKVEQNFENNWDFEGSSFAVCHKGKMVVDLWGGFADSSAARLWREDTLSVVFSTTKAICALCLAMLVDKDLIKYNDLVTKYWPEFGQNGKDKITVKMLASHQAGLANIDEPITLELIGDWQRIGAAFEKQKPLWELGKHAGYHAYTYGWVIDQLIRRVDPKKRSVSQFFREEIAEPYGLDFYIGLPPELEYRVTRVTQPRIRDFLSHLFEMEFIKKMYAIYRDPDSLLSSIQKNWFSQDAIVYNNPEFHALEIGAINGFGTARALAKLFCIVDSGKLISKSTLEQITKPVIINERDRVMSLNLTWGYGFLHTKNPDDKYVIGHPGFGGQNVKYDPHYGLSMAYIRNGLSPDMGDSWSFIALEHAVYEAIKT